MATAVLYPEPVFGAPKKTGKTAIAAMHLLTTTLLFGGRFGEGYALANDLEQAQGRVFQAVRRICEASPLLRRDAVITQSRLEFPQTGLVIQVGSDYAGATRCSMEGGSLRAWHEPDDARVSSPVL